MTNQISPIKKEREKIAREIEEACRLFYEIDKQMVEEWEVADAEV